MSLPPNKALQRTANAFVQLVSCLALVLGSASAAVAGGR